MAARRPHPALRNHVRRYVGWYEHMKAPLCRRELPTDEIPVIISFGAAVRVFDAGDSERFSDLGSFATGAYDSYVRVVSSGPSGGLQINFTILGARLFLGQPLMDLRNRSVPLEDLLGPLAGQLTGRLNDAASWAARFEILDRTIAARLGAACRPAPEVVWTWNRIASTGGRVGIGRLVDEVGWSRKRLIDRFRGEIGLSPKLMARILRFARAAERLRSTNPGSLTDIAQDCGYYDQSHFTRDFRAFAGVTPLELVASVLPDNGGIAADR
jgi:AraC-like DNA-binding protein